LRVKQASRRHCQLQLLLARRERQKGEPYQPGVALSLQAVPVDQRSRVAQTKGQGGKQEGAVLPLCLACAFCMEQQS